MNLLKVRYGFIFRVK